MPRTFGARRNQFLSIEAENAEQAAESYESVGERIQSLEEPMYKAFDYLEEDEREHFIKMKGRYVRTGATKASLTERHNPGAIRIVHRGGAYFGTKVEHAIYLTKAPRDAENEQVLKANGHRSAVLISKKRTHRKIAELVGVHAVAEFGQPRAT